jgi:RNA polymerase sigma-70 factor (ECF subfamily)
MEGSPERATPASQDSDALLVARCREGEEGAWSELVERFSRYIFAIATQGFRLSEADAEDVFQEAFARTYESLDKLRDDAAIRPWLAQLTRRLCVDRLRQAARVSPSEDLEPAVDEGDESVFDQLETAMSLRDSLSSLSDECQQVLDRFFARDQSYRMISEALGIPQGTIASRISRCLTKLRSEYEGLGRKQPSPTS